MACGGGGVEGKFPFVWADGGARACRAWYLTALPDDSSDSREGGTEGMIDWSLDDAELHYCGRHAVCFSPPPPRCVCLFSS